MVNSGAPSDGTFKAWIVGLILGGKPEKALEFLAETYGVHVPSLKVGLPKGHKIKAFGCYTAKNQTIFVLNSDVLANPFVIIHEFYHHLRSKGVDRQHRGTERGADEFAMDFLREYETLVKCLSLGQMSSNQNRQSLAQ
jgi:Zn-dependent peptidase ImmA (M78 family)